MRICLVAFLSAASLLFFGAVLCSWWHVSLWWRTGTGAAAAFSSAVLVALLVSWLHWSMCGFIDNDILFFRPSGKRSAIDEALVQSQTTTAKLEVFRVNLDLPPQRRWVHIIEQLVRRGEAERMKAVIVFQMVELFGKAGGIVLSLVMKVLLTAHARFCMPAYFRQELLGIAELTAPRGLTYFDLLTLNYGGDFAANCTSGVVKVQTESGSVGPVHLRNMDWFPQEDFRHLCVQLDMYQDDQLLFSSTSWLFIVGSYTVMRRGGELKGAYSISMNFRLRDEGVHWNVLSMLGLRAAWPQALLVRDCAQSTVGFQAAVKRMSCTKLIAPCYFIMAGCGAADGVVVERTRTGSDTVDRLSVSNVEAAPTENIDEAKEMERFVLVTNCDLRCQSLKLSWTHEDPLLMNALLRRQAARTLFNSYFLQTLQNKNTDLNAIVEGACDVLSSAPLNNYQTVFGVVMIPRHDIMVSRSWPVSADSRKWDKRLVGGAYSDADLLAMRVMRQ